jgi:hypothetical protein
MLFLSTLECGKIILKTVSVKDNRNTEINVQLKERKKEKEEWRYNRSNFPLKFKRLLPFEGN